RPRRPPTGGRGPGTGGDAGPPRRPRRAAEGADPGNPLPPRAHTRQCRGMAREDDPGTGTASGDPGGRGGLPVRAVREPTPDDVTAARAVVTAHLRPTPVVPVRLPGAEGEVLLKLESLQPTGSFKVRG